MKTSVFYYCIIALILFQSCQKEVSLQTTNDTGKYEFVSSSGSCATPVVNGTWQVGKALDQTNTVLIPIHVTEKGSWSYSQEANGIKLAGSGNFTDTGFTALTLKATGTPSQEGISSFVLSAAAACSLQVTVLAATGGNPDPGGTLDGPYYYKATIGGVNFEVRTKAAPIGDDDYWVGYTLAGFEEVVFGAWLGPNSSPKIGLTEMEVSKGIFFDYFDAPNSAMKNFFAPGSYSYITADSINIPNASGISILWRDAEGKLWSTGYGTADQTGSTFKIISVAEEFDPMVIYSLKVKMQFSCKLYKEDTGEMKLLTNGEMLALFGRI